MEPWFVARSDQRRAGRSARTARGEFGTDRHFRDRAAAKPMAGLRPPSRSADARLAAARDAGGAVAQPRSSARDEQRQRGRRARGARGDERELERIIYRAMSLAPALAYTSAC
jgi:hypothetical protein